MKILLVEDSAVQGESLQMLLRVRGHECDWAANADSALARMGVHAYDALIIDQYMPGLDGLGLIRRVREVAAWRGAPVILLTAVSGDALDEARERLKGLRPAALVRKPCDLAEIEAALAGLTTPGGG